MFTEICESPALLSASTHLEAAGTSQILPTGTYYIKSAIIQKNAALGESEIIDASGNDILHVDLAETFRLDYDRTVSSSSITLENTGTGNTSVFAAVEYSLASSTVENCYRPYDIYISFLIEAVFVALGIGIMVLISRRW